MLEKLLAEAKLPLGEAISDNTRSMLWPACGHMYLFMRAPVVGRMPVFELRVTEQIIHSSIYPQEMVKRVGAYLAKAELVNATTKIERNLRLVSSLLNALLQAPVIPVPVEVYPWSVVWNDSVCVRAIEEGLHLQIGNQEYTSLPIVSIISLLEQHFSKPPDNMETLLKASMKSLVP